MSGVTELFGDWMAKVVVWAIAALIIQVLAIHWGARFSGLRGSLGRAFLAFLMILVVVGAGRFFLFALVLVLPIEGLLLLVLELVLAVGVQSVAMLLLYRAELPRALLASFLTSVLAVALMTPLTLLLV